MDDERIFSLQWVGGELELETTVLKNWVIPLCSIYVHEFVMIVAHMGYMFQIVCKQRFSLFLGICDNSKLNLTLKVR